jgi:mono/diheme cytochrome c family protein
MRIRMIGAVAAVIAVAGCVEQAEEVEETVSGRALFDTYCVACHGTGGRGDGPDAASLPRPPADLTLIAERNGGTFPLARVMSKIDGYTAGPQAAMPALGPVLDGGPTILVDTGDGVQTPTPANLVALAEYLRTIQR